MPIKMKIVEHEPYFDWLCEKVERRGQTRDFKAFLKDLSLIEFYSLIPNDENRAEDGLRYRDEWSDISYGLFVPGGPCTFLEMLIGLSERMDFILYNLDNRDQKARWFWKMIENLDLETFNYDDRTQVIIRKRRDNREKIERLLERKYSDTGQGGLFPLRNPLKDQRETEIWYQMQYWIEEHFHI